MSTTETIPVSYFLNSKRPAAGVEVMVLHADREAPVHWKDGQSFFTLGLHEDGSLCLNACGCVTETNLWLYDDQSRTVGEWTWNGFRNYAIGWHRTGPSTAEQQLSERIELLEEDLDHEAGLHHITKADLGHCIRRIEKLQVRRVAIRESLRRSRKASAEAEGRFRLAFQAASAGWFVAIFIAVLWISGVIA